MARLPTKPKNRPTKTSTTPTRETPQAKIPDLSWRVSRSRAATATMATLTPTKKSRYCSGRMTTSASLQFHQGPGNNPNSRTMLPTMAISPPTRTRFEDDIAAPAFVLLFTIDSAIVKETAHLPRAYSLKCVEGEFSEVELPLYGVLGSSSRGTEPYRARQT